MNCLSIQSADSESPGLRMTCADEDFPNLHREPKGGGAASLG
jgi:hypothetical protein